MTELDTDTRERLEQAVELVARIASGDFAARHPISDRRDEIDAVFVGLNMLAEDFAAERARRELAEERLRDAIDAYDSAPGMFCSVDPEGVVLQCNATMARWLGRSREAIVGGPLTELYGPDGSEVVRRAIAALMQGLPLPAHDHELRRADGGVVTTLVSGSVRHGGDGNPTRIRLIYRDVTEARRLEGELVQAQKMEGIGRLAGGVAHDFNNLLTAIFASASLLRRQVTSSSALDDLDILEQAAEKAADLTKQLLSFSRRSAIAPVPTQLDEVLARMEKLLRRTLGSNVTVVTVREGRAWPVLVDPGRFEQVVMNLAVNARDAMPEGGRLTLGTRNVAGSVDGRLGLEPGEYVVFTVADQGVGMPDDVLDHLFEPFFTTKEPGKGTGLGLSTVHGIVRQAGGRISVRSELGRGTTFEVYLPRAPGADVVDAARGTSAPTSTDDRPTILLVEDDAVVRAHVHRSLQEAGYVVHVAQDEPTALERARARVGSFDLVITDLDMPGVVGRELVQRLGDVGVVAPVLFLAGFTSEPRAAQRSWDRDVDILAKPFTPSALLQQVRSRIRRQPNRATEA